MLRETSPSAGAVETEAGAETADEEPLPPQAASRPAAPAAPAAHPLAGQETIRLDSLRDTPFVLPVRQTLHLRYPLGRRLSEPERYLAALLAEERLVDPRYQAADSPFVRQLLEEVAAPAPSGAEGAEALPGPAPEAVPEINLDSKTLEYLAAIVEEQSLSRAAERFYLAQPALSRTLHHVEEMVGLPLFSREHNRLRPTAAGAVFVNSARNILRIEREMFERTRTCRAGRGGHLYLSCDPLFSAVLHEKVEPAFRRLHPELSLVIAEQDRAAFDPPRPLYLLLARHPGRALPAAASDLQTLIRQALDGAFLLSG